MSIVDDLQSLDINEPGRWPKSFRAVAIGLVFVAVVAAGFYFFIYREQMPALERFAQEEEELRGTFEQRQRRAANFDAYRAQLAEIERNFGTMLRQLPGRTEVDNLLVDISQTGLAAGLEEERFVPMTEVREEFYAELPIEMTWTGSYHEFGQFVSGIAGLPRIVTLHDIHIRPVNEDAVDLLTLDVTAKTYRYLEGEEAEQ